MALFQKKTTQPESQVDFERLPRHIAIIMDGNGRWAKKRGLPRTAGHAAGAEFAPVQGKNITALFYYKSAIKRMFATALIPIAMRKHRAIEPSMLQDIKKGKPCEIDSINGIVCEWGRRYGVPTPFNDRIVKIVKECEKGKWDPSPSNIHIFDDLY